MSSAADFYTDFLAFEACKLFGEVSEREMENALTNRIAEGLRELGPGAPIDNDLVDLLFLATSSLNWRRASSSSTSTSPL
ncbi:hypothetical protein LN996_04060 [Arthrobacter sp. AK01]|uniref:hypothetical protein n=1 Tax=Arthrobacter sp. AK01 TaxID=2894084 RepID=UPI001E3F0368|nr:hypothetical protein [Arthrobacter sp. AK01]MCD4849978.1 hypothetical protein [Arthrobacter sp. AK01]